MGIHKCLTYFMFMISPGFRKINLYFLLAIQFFIFLEKKIVIGKYKPDFLELSTKPRSQLFPRCHAAAARRAGRQCRVSSSPVRFRAKQPLLVLASCTYVEFSSPRSSFNLVTSSRQTVKLSSNLKNSPYLY